MARRTELGARAVEAAVLHHALPVDVEVGPVIGLRHELIEPVDIHSDVAAPAACAEDKAQIDICL